MHLTALERLCKSISKRLTLDSKDQPNLLPGQSVQKQVCLRGCLTATETENQRRSSGKKALPKFLTCCLAKAFKSRSA